VLAFECFIPNTSHPITATLRRDCTAAKFYAERSCWMRAGTRMLNQDCLQKFQRDPALAPCWNEAFRIPSFGSVAWPAPSAPPRPSMIRKLASHRLGLRPPTIMILADVGELAP
jgi:hypothetical protein